MLIAMVMLLGLSIAGIVLQLKGHTIGGTALLIAGGIVAAAFHSWSRRRWAEHRAGLK